MGRLSQTEQVAIAWLMTGWIFDLIHDARSLDTLTTLYSRLVHGPYPMFYRTGKLNVKMLRCHSLLEAMASVS